MFTGLLAAGRAPSLHLHKYCYVVYIGCPGPGRKKPPSLIPHYTPPCTGELKTNLCEDFTITKMPTFDTLSMIEILC